MVPPVIIIERLIKILENAREKNHMYFRPVTPDIVMSWINGARNGVSLANVHWQPEDRRIAVEKRGLEYRAAAWETDGLGATGMDEVAIVDELLAIESEMWFATRERLMVS